MTRYLTILMIFNSIICSLGQIRVVEEKNDEKFLEIGEAKFAGTTWAQVKKRGDTYIIFYRDANYQYLVDFEYFAFEDINNDFEGLYSMILDGLAAVPEDDIKLELPEDVVWLHFEKSMGIPSVQFLHSKKGGSIKQSAFFSRKKVDQLFGK